MELIRDPGTGEWRWVLEEEGDRSQGAVGTAIPTITPPSPEEVKKDFETFDYSILGFPKKPEPKPEPADLRWDNNQWWDPLGVVPNPKPKAERVKDVDAALEEQQSHITRLTPPMDMWANRPQHTDPTHPDYDPAWHNLSFEQKAAVKFTPPHQPLDPKEWDLGDRLTYGIGDLGRGFFNMVRGAYENTRDTGWSIGQHIHSWFGSEIVDPVDKFDHIRFQSKQEKLGWDIPLDTAIAVGGGSLALGLGAVVATLLIGGKALKSVQLASKGTALGRAGTVLITPFQAAGARFTRLGQAVISKWQSLPRQAVLAVRTRHGRTSTQSNGGYLPITKERLAVLLGITAAGGILLGVFVQAEMQTQATSTVEGITLAQEGRRDELPSEQAKACQEQLGDDTSKKNVWQEGTDVFFDAELSNYLETSKASKTNLAVELNSVLKCANGDRSIGRIINDATGKVFYQYGKVTP